MVLQKKTYDLVVVGGGIVGLWVAKRAVDQGLSVLVAEKRKIGAGASGGILGALIPHVPTGWIEKKQFQFDALTELSTLTAELEDETGLSTGYGRVGRLMPLRKERFIEVAKRNELSAKEFWWQQAGSFDFSLGHDNRFSDWLSADCAHYGYTLDTLAARVNPRAYLAVLAAYLDERATVTEGLDFEAFNNGTVTFKEEADPVDAGAVVLAQGYETYPYLQETHDLDIGTGIKGQAAFFELGNTQNLPIIFDDGVYIVPHDNGICAVGSTAQKEWTHPDEPDFSETGFIEKAITLCPRLKEAPLMGRWAGVRPKNYKREPIVGKLLEDVPLYIATGGFKVSFGFAHRLAEALVDEIVGRESSVRLPETFTVRHHLDTHTT